MLVRESSCVDPEELCGADFGRCPDADDEEANECESSALAGDCALGTCEDGAEQRVCTG